MVHCAPYVCTLCVDAANILYSGFIYMLKTYAYFFVAMPTVESDVDAERVLFSYGFGASVPSTSRKRMQQRLEHATSGWVGHWSSQGQRLLIIKTRTGVLDMTVVLVCKVHACVVCLIFLNIKSQCATGQTGVAA